MNGELWICIMGPRGRAGARAGVWGHSSSKQRHVARYPKPWFLASFRDVLRGLDSLLIDAINFNMICYKDGISCSIAQFCLVACNYNRAFRSVSKPPPQNPVRTCTAMLHTRCSHIQEQFGSACSDYDYINLSDRAAGRGRCTYNMGGLE